MLNVKLYAVTVAVAGMALVQVSTFAQSYPTRPIRIITGPVGGASDPTSRLIAQGISGPLGQPVIVDNRNAVTAAEALVKGPADGYSLVVSGPNIYTAPLLQQMSYDAEKDLAPITSLFRTVNILVVNPSVPANSVKDLIALAKAKPGQLNYSSGGAGGTAHIVTALFTSMAGINMVRVAFKEAAPRVTSVISGEVHVAINEASLLAPHIKSGRLRGLGVTSSTPSRLVPDLPTIAASGVPGYEAVSTFGIWAAGKTPRVIITRLNREIVRVIDAADVKDKLLLNGQEVIANSPEQSAQMIKDDVRRVSKVIKDANIKLESN
jgi:tripartite-type tricarboxylate transporter receptor subunit TctC